VLLEHETAWKDFKAAVLEFTGQSAAKEPATEAAAAALTERELELFALLRQGRSNSEIAWQLGIAEKTVRNHFSNLYRKLGVRSRVEALVRTQGIPEA
jgi:DNA-binding NarL/FixJ family response regulator